MPRGKNFGYVLDRRLGGLVWKTVKNKKDASPDGNPSLLPRSSNLSTLTWIPWLSG